MTQTYDPEALDDELTHYGSEPTIRVVMMPKHTNALGSIFGGVILSQLDLAAGEEARKTAQTRVVTKLMREVEFVAPVDVGDWVGFYTRTEEVGGTSVAVSVLVIAQRGHDREHFVKVTEAELVFVAVDDDGRPVPVDPAERTRGPGNEREP